MAIRIPDLLWAVHDPSRSIAFDAISWASVGMAMPAFFALSGFFAARLYDARGPRGFARDRARRILVPFLVAVATILPGVLAVWALGWLGDGRCSWEQLRGGTILEPRIADNILGPGHLWFLEYLVLMLAAYGLLRASRAAPSATRDGPTIHRPASQGLRGRPSSWPCRPP